jgi:multiple sugar transport system permease protein
MDMTLTRTKEKTRHRINWRAQGLAYLFLAPALFIIALVSYYPTLQTVLYSFQDVGLMGPKGWVGLHNYVRLLGNPEFLVAWRNAFSFVMMSLGTMFLVPIILALMINELRRLAPVFQFIVYLPALIPIPVALLVWRTIYQPDWGVLNSLLKYVGLAPQLWLENASLAKPALMVIMTWIGIGGPTLIYLSAIREIPAELIEAAELEGISPLQRIWYILVPLIWTRIQIMLVFQVVLVAQVFNEPFMLTHGGPANSTVTPVLELYNVAFGRSDFGLASAWGVSILIMLSVFSVFFVWLRKEEAGIN